MACLYFCALPPGGLFLLRDLLLLIPSLPAFFAAVRLAAGLRSMFGL